MPHRVAQGRLLLVGAGFIALVAVALFAVLGLGSGSLDPADLPVVWLGQATGPEEGEQPPATTSVSYTEGSTDGQSPTEASGEVPTSEVPTSEAASPAGDQPGGDSPVSTAGSAGSPGTTKTGQGSTSTSRAGSPATTGTQASTQTTGQVATTTTTTTERETVTGGIRVQTGPGVTQGVGGGSTPGGGANGPSPGTTGRRR